ncbi:MAG: SCO family protein [Gammaproteobacteria bacterium]|nr:SCO family protein [Gammaproteobacteria bacterium]
MSLSTQLARQPQVGFRGFVLLILIMLIFFSLPFIPALLQDEDVYGLAGDRPAPQFSLRDADGKLVTLADYRGKYLFLMFGYLHCPDVCHAQAILFQEIDFHADMQNQLQFIYIAMDPDRDSAAQLAAYFDQRGDNFTSLRNDDKHSIQALAGAYRAYFASEAAAVDEDYLIQHPGHYYLIGPDGHIRRTYAATQSRTDLIVGDLAQLLKDYQGES